MPVCSDSWLHDPPGSGGAVGLTTSIQLKLQSQALLTGTSLALGRCLGRLCSYEQKGTCENADNSRPTTGVELFRVKFSEKSRHQIISASASSRKLSPALRLS